MTGEAAIGLLVTALVGLGGLGFEFWRRRDQTAARRRDARVLAMELLPIAKAIHEDLERARELISKDPHYLNLSGWQERRIIGVDVLEPALHRLAVLDQETIRSIDGMGSAIRDYHRMRSQTDMCQLTSAALPGELSQRRSSLEAACPHAAEAVKRLQATANKG